jgi:hypothetical protein
MKRIAYFFLLMLLASCESQSDLQGDRIRVVFRDTLSIPHEYYLLSVRDTAFVVAPGFFDTAGPPKVIPFSKIDRVFHDNGGRSTGALLGGLAGFGAVMGAMFIYGKTHDVGGGEGLAFGAAFISIPAIIIGAVIGYDASDDEKGYYPSSQTLREYARYRDKEPPELQKIK